MARRFPSNVLSYRILGYCKAKQRQVSTLYLRALAVADCFALVFGVLFMSVNMLLRPAVGHLPGDPGLLAVVSSTYPVCSVRLYLTFSSYLVAVYIIVAFSLKRCLVVLRPFYWMKALTIRRARATLGALVAACFIFCLPALFSYDREAAWLPPAGCSGSGCNCSAAGAGCTRVEFCAIDLQVFKPFALVESLVEFGVPFCITAACNVAIVAKVRSRDPNARKRQQQQQLQQQQQQPDRSVTKRLLMVSFAFLALTLPRCVYQVVTRAMRGSYCTEAMANFLSVALTLNSLNYSVNFVIYCISELQFRRLAKALLLCQSRRLRRLVSFMNEPPPRNTRESTPTLLLTTSQAGRRTSATTVADNSDSSRLQRAPAPVVGRLVSQSALAYVQVQLRRSADDLRGAAAPSFKESVCDPRNCTLLPDCGYDSTLFAESDCLQPRVLRWSEVTPE